MKSLSEDSETLLVDVRDLRSVPTSLNRDTRISVSMAWKRFDMLTRAPALKYVLDIDLLLLDSNLKDEQSVPYTLGKFDIKSR